MKTEKTTDFDLLQRLDAAQTSAYFASPDGATRLFAFGERAHWQSGDGDLMAWVARQQARFGADVFIFGAPGFEAHSEAGFWFVPETVIDAHDIMLATSAVPTSQILTQQDEEDWPTRVAEVIDKELLPGHLQKVVLGRQRELTVSAPLLIADALQQLRQQQPLSYHVALKHDGQVFISATPERLVKVQQGEVATAGVAGTTKRASDPIADALLGEQLLADAKNQHEHAVVVQTIVAQLQDLTQQLQVPAAPILLKNAQMQHLYTPITAKLADDVTLLDVMQRLHPTPALGGQPRQLALAVIQRVERDARGLFASPIGFFNGLNDGEFVVGIRALWARDTTVRLFAGAGILSDSQPASEYQETDLKMRPMMTLFENEV
ncbi:MAG TPA: isochorismate synthase [Lactobacillaceae bacterium]|jgi:menaquinone-specific isochorismate synthase